MREYKNIMVMTTGDVYTFETATVDPSIWLDELELTTDDITLLQGQIFSRLHKSEDSPRYPDVDESVVDTLYNWIHRSRPDASPEMRDAGLSSDYQLTRAVIEKHGGNFYEFLSLALAEGSALIGEFVAVHDAIYEAYNVYLEERYGISEDHEIFMHGLAELDMDAVAEQYDGDSGNVLLQGENIVYEVAVVY